MFLSSMQKSLAVLAEFTSVPGMVNNQACITTLIKIQARLNDFTCKSACLYLAQVQSSTDSATTILHTTLICYTSRNEPTETPIFNWWQEEQKKASADCP